MQTINAVSVQVSSKADENPCFIATFLDRPTLGELCDAIEQEVVDMGRKPYDRKRSDKLAGMRGLPELVRASGYEGLTFEGQHYTHIVKIAGVTVGTITFSPVNIVVNPTALRRRLADLASASS